MLRVIKTEDEYEDALAKAYTLIQEDIEAESEKLDELELLTLLIEHYEKEHYPISAPSPIEAIKFRLEQLNKPVSELSEILGARSRQSEILSGKRKLSLAMIRKLHSVLGIPAESLILEYWSYILLVYVPILYLCFLNFIFKSISLLYFNKSCYAGIIRN